MRREGNIIEEIITPENMEESFWTVLRGRKRKRSRSGRTLIAHKKEVIDELTERIRNGVLKLVIFLKRRSLKVVNYVASKFFL